jgi:hypothetical protein
LDRVACTVGTSKRAARKFEAWPALRVRRPMWMRWRIPMTVHVDEMISEVSAEGAAAPQAAAPAPDWQELARQRELRAQVARDLWRTAAEGFDD